MAGIPDLSILRVSSSNGSAGGARQVGNNGENSRLTSVEDAVAQLADLDPLDA